MDESAAPKEKEEGKPEEAPPEEGKPEEGAPKEEPPEEGAPEAASKGGPNRRRKASLPLSSVVPSDRRGGMLPAPPASRAFMPAAPPDSRAFRKE